MNIFNRGIMGPKSGQPQETDRKVKLLLALLVILGATLVFLATPYSEQTLGIKLSSLFSSANLSSTADQFPSADTTGTGTVTSSGGTVFNCIVAPCLNPDLSITNPELNAVWVSGNTYTISWNGVSGATYSLKLIPGSCDNTRLCGTEIIIADKQPDQGTTKWTVPKDLAASFYGKVDTLELTIDGISMAQTSVQIVQTATDPGTQIPDGSFFRLQSDPNKIFRLENGTKRQLPFPAEEVITCLGFNPANILNGTSAQETLPVGAPLFCNPISAVVSHDGSLISGLPDSDVTAIYLIQNGTRRPFPTNTIFSCLGYSYTDVHIANIKDANLPIGDPMSCSGSTSSSPVLSGTGTLPDGVVGVSYSAQIGATGGTLPYTFTITDISPSNTTSISINNSGQILGTFTSVGTYSITIKVTDSVGKTATKVYTLVITSAPTSGGNTGGSGGGINTAQDCVSGPVGNLVALYRYYSSRDSDHYFSTNAVAPSGYQSEGITAYIYPTQVSGTVAVYQSYNPDRKDHYYTTDQADSQTYGYRLDGIVGYVYPTQVSGSSPLYRMYNGTGLHYLMTSSTVERDAILGIGFVQQGFVGYTCGSARPGSEIIPIYRMWNPTIFDHFYTTNIHERDDAITHGYISEGIAGNMLSVPGSDRIAVYRLWSSKYTGHFYTTSEAEARSSGYSREGIIGYIYANPSNSVAQWYRLYSSKILDHFYTASSSERDSAINSGYKFEGTMGYLP